MMFALFSGVLDSKGGTLRSPEELLESVQLTEESAWMGVYLKGAKVGYVSSRLTPLPNGNYEIVEFSRISGAMMGSQQAMIIQMNVIADSALALISFEGNVSADPYITRFQGSLDERVLWINVETGGQNTRRFIPAPEPIYLSQSIKPLVQNGHLKDGDSLKLAGFDPIQLSMQDLIVIGAPVLKHRVNGKDIEARKLVTRLQGFESYIYVDENGETIAEQGPLGLEMIREDMETALTLDESEGRVDFLNVYAVTPKGEIEKARKTNFAKFRIKYGSTRMPQLPQDRMSVKDANDGSMTVEVNREPFAIHNEYQNDVEGYLMAEPFIESDDRMIIKAAEKAVTGGKTRMDSLILLSNWIYKTVAKKPSAGIPSALAVLNQRSGDCNEHTTLFTAMARAVGIPCRMQLGIVYQDGKFYYHAWPAALVDQKWYEFEPTFGLELADAARISLAVGDMSNAISLVELIGNIEIEILDYN